MSRKNILVKKQPDFPCLSCSIPKKDLPAKKQRIGGAVAASVTKTGEFEIIVGDSSRDVDLQKAIFTVVNKWILFRNFPSSRKPVTAPP